MILCPFVENLRPGTYGLAVQASLATSFNVVVNVSPQVLFDFLSSFCVCISIFVCSDFLFFRQKFPLPAHIETVDCKEVPEIEYEYSRQKGYEVSCVEDGVSYLLEDNPYQFEYI
jgi:hypothetical protein